MFVVPETRIPLIWGELMGRCKAADIIVVEIRQPSCIKIGDLGQGCYLAVTGWRNLLGMLAAAADSDGDIRTRNDICQLQGLCDRWTRMHLCHCGATRLQIWRSQGGLSIFAIFRSMSQQQRRSVDTATGRVFGKLHNGTV